MVPEKTYPFLATLLSPFWKRHQKTLGLMITAIAVTGQARSFAIATTVARWLGTRLDSAVNRFYRLLRNERVDYTLFAAQWARLLVRGKERLLQVSIDWTEWHHDLRMLMAAVVSGKRAIPLFAQAFPKKVWSRSQNARENTFLRVLAWAIQQAEAKAIILCDRGFRRVSWIELLQKLHLGFVVRLKDDVHVQLATGLLVPLHDVLLTQGRMLDLGVVPIRSDGKVQARVVGYWAPGLPEPWWLATSEEGPASRILSLYDRRMTVEEQFRDTKGRRFGVKLIWTQFRDPEALARFMMLLAVALLIWTIAGKVAAAKDSSLRLHSRKKGPRQSYVTIGLRIATIEAVPITLSASAIRKYLEPPALRRIAGARRGGK
jgi:hypothetical protein